MRARHIHKRSHRRITLSDVAERAGVTAAAVSKALRGHEDIAPRTRVRIGQIARELAYRPNLAGRALATQRTSIIALVTPFPQFAAVGERLQGVQSAAAAEDYLAVAAFHDGSKLAELHQIESLRGRIDGIVLTPAHCSTSLRRLAQSLEVPCVCMSEPFPELTGDYVGDDDEAGGRLAVRHLLESGRRHIAYLGSHQHSASDNSILKGMRLEAGSAGMCAAGPSVRWNCIDESGTRRAVKSLMELRRPPDAIVAFSDIVALWAMRQIQNSGRNVPEDVALVGYDDTPIAAWAPIPLTSVAQPSEQIGRRAAKLLLDIILKRHYDDSSGPIIFPPTLNVRASTQTTGAKT